MALKAGLGPLGACRTHMVNSDSPEKLDVPALYAEFTALECISADPLHIALRVEKAPHEATTEMSLLLRLCMTKFRFGVLDDRPYFRCGRVAVGCISLDGAVAATVNHGTDRRVHHMAKGSAYIEQPYSDTVGFVWDVATLVHQYPNQMGRKKTGKGTTVLQSLIHTCTPHQLEYLANHGRFVHRNPDVGVPYGTTPNEAYHNEIKSMFRNIRVCSKAYVRTHAKIATLVKLIAGHLSALPTSRGQSQSSLLHHFCNQIERTALEFWPLIGQQFAKHREGGARTCSPVP